MSLWRNSLIAAIYVLLLVILLVVYCAVAFDFGEDHPGVLTWWSGLILFLLVAAAAAIGFAWLYSNQNARLALVVGIAATVIACVGLYLFLRRPIDVLDLAVIVLGYLLIAAAMFVMPWVIDRADDLYTQRFGDGDPDEPNQTRRPHATTRRRTTTKA